jgi:hypothetical protein
MIHITQRCNTETLRQKCTNLPKSRNHLRILGARRVTRSKFLTEDPKTLDATVKIVLPRWPSAWNGVRQLELGEYRVNQTFSWLLERYMKRQIFFRCDSIESDRTSSDFQKTPAIFSLNLDTKQVFYSEDGSSDINSSKKLVNIWLHDLTSQQTAICKVSTLRTPNFNCLRVRNFESAEFNKLGWLQSQGIFIIPAWNPSHIEGRTEIENVWERHTEYSICTWVGGKGSTLEGIT